MLCTQIAGWRHAGFPLRPLVQKLVVASASSAQSINSSLSSPVLSSCCLLLRCGPLFLLLPSPSQSKGPLRPCKFQTQLPTDFILTSLPLTRIIRSKRRAPARQVSAPGSAAGCTSGSACNQQHCTPCTCEPKTGPAKRPPVGSRRPLHTPHSQHLNGRNSPILPFSYANTGSLRAHAPDPRSGILNPNPRGRATAPRR